MARNPDPGHCENLSPISIFKVLSITGYIAGLAEATMTDAARDQTGLSVTSIQQV